MRKMMVVQKRFGLLIYSILWATIGVLLLSKGIKFLLESVWHPSPLSLASLLKRTSNDPNHHAVILLTFSLFVGHLKGKFIIRKSALRQIERLNAFTKGIPIKKLFSKVFLLLMLAMMSLGLALRFLPVPLEWRGMIDCAIGMALIQGGATYLREGLFPSTSTL